MIIDRSVVFNRAVHKRSPALYVADGECYGRCNKRLCKVASAWQPVSGRTRAAVVFSVMANVTPLLHARVLLKPFNRTSTPAAAAL
jgi:hypothetical protein